MSTPETKFKAALVIAKVRGYKKLNEKQVQDLTELTLVPELSAVDCVNAILDAPAERTARTVKSIRNSLSRGFKALATIAEPEDK